MTATPRRRRTTYAMYATALAATLALPDAARADDAPAHGPQSGPKSGPQSVLGARDGWASEGAGTTGGSAADAAHVFTVDAHTDDRGRALTCTDCGPTR
ncbi:hypothetical protein [Streptomyces sp. NPDC048442]|uniref:hypothetical protein n=1 Tax=Streptomyces sp. NPDC048442 TaxID=3154823 RepID=UPI00342595A1